MPADSVKSTIQIHGEGLWLQLPETITQHERAQQAQLEISNTLACSHYLFRQFTQFPERLNAIIENQWHLKSPDTAATDWLRERLSCVTNEQTLSALLRECRHLYMSSIAWRDLNNRLDIEQSLLEVSALADALINAAYHWLYDSLTQRYGKPMGQMGPLPMLILGMGKLGGKELNYSSDIDLIFAYPEKGETQGGRKSIENQQFFTKLAQKLIGALNTITMDGQVYRVDMRLRPFGESGPLVASFAALEDYYQDQGRHWERFAMVKARVLNPEQQYSEELEAILKPFTFRRYLDFTTIDALRNMKSMIASETRRKKLTNNIKLGTGGIREVEFFAQSFQLIHGGREASLQHKSLKTTLDALADMTIIPSQEAKNLYDNYLFLRKVEHTLQQWNDEQTQTLPSDTYQQAVLSQVCGFDSYSKLFHHCQQVQQSINRQFSALIEDTVDSHDEDDSLYQQCVDAWQLALEHDEFVNLFEAQNYRCDFDSLFNLVSDFKKRLSKHRIGQRGEDTLNKLMPEVLYTLLCECPTLASNVLPRVLGVIHAVTGRTTYLDLMFENPNVLKQLFKLLSRSQWIGDQIQRFPLLLDELLNPIYLNDQVVSVDEIKSEYRRDLQQSMLRVDPDDVEAIMDTWRQFKLTHQLRIAAADISGSLPIAKVSDKLTVLAEVLVENVLHHAWQHCEAKYGVPNHLDDNALGFAIVGYGKVGGWELGYGSDLDLVCIHDAPRNSVTNGKKSISAQQFYIKLVQRMLHLISTKTLLGEMYEVDLRLRPSGNSGLLSCHIDGFTSYQQNDAWTWEHQALVRARVLVADGQLADKFNTTRRQILALPREEQGLLADVRDMRTKMREHLLKDSQGIDLKQSEGGITDIEFMVQYWVLRHAQQFSEITDYSDNLRILECLAQANIIDSQSMAGLQEAYLSLREAYHQLTLADEKYAMDSDTLSQIRHSVRENWQRLFAS